MEFNCLQILCHVVSVNVVIYCSMRVIELSFLVLISQPWRSVLVVAAVVCNTEVATALKCKLCGITDALTISP